jgi:hypothetical protein
LWCWSWWSHRWGADASTRWQPPSVIMLSFLSISLDAFGVQSSKTLVCYFFTPYLSDMSLVVLSCIMWCTSILNPTVICLWSCYLSIIFLYAAMLVLVASSFIPLVCNE